MSRRLFFDYRECSEKKTTMMPSYIPSTTITHPSLASTVDDVYRILTGMKHGMREYIINNKSYIATVFNWIVNTADTSRAKKWLAIVPHTWVDNVIRIAKPTPEKVAVLAMLFPNNKAVSAAIAGDYKSIEDMAKGYDRCDVANAIPFALTLRDLTYMRICIDHAMSVRVVADVAKRMTKNWLLIDEETVVQSVTCIMARDAIMFPGWHEKGDEFILKVLRHGSGRLIRHYILDAPVSTQDAVGVTLNRHREADMWKNVRYLYACGFRICHVNRCIVDERFMDTMIMSGNIDNRYKIRADGYISETPSKKVRAAVRACKANDHGYVSLPDAQREYMRIVTRIASKLPGDAVIICRDE